MTGTPETALIYCRVSDTKQKLEGSGLTSQQHRCEQHAAKQGYQVEKIFHDDFTGGGDFMQRPGLVELLRYLESHPQDNYVVIIDDLKRLARETVSHWQIRYALEKLGASLECLNYKFDNTPEGEFVETLFAAQGQLERKQIGRQTRQKTKARLEAGYHAFIATVGYRYEKSKVHGNVLVRDEPAASVVTEMMEGFASGRFQTKEEARRFLEDSPDFPKTASGKIGNSRVFEILTNPLYAGYIEYKSWGVTLRKGHHEGLVSYETFCRIQDRLAGRPHAPARKSINQDFPLRNAVACECGNALTSCWSKSRSGKRHLYYLCVNRKCDYKGKSIRRDVLEGAFEDLLKNLVPSRPLMAIAEKMFKMLWEQRRVAQASRKASFETKLKKLERDSEQLLDRIVDTSNPTVIQAIEKRIETIQKEKLILEEKITNCAQPVRPFDAMYRTAMTFLKNPYDIWASGSFEVKRAVLKLVITDRLIWDRKGLYRTPDLSLPFKLLGDLNMPKMEMVPRGGIEPPTRGFSVLCSTN